MFQLKVRILTTCTLEDKDTTIKDTTGNINKL